MNDKLLSKADVCEILNISQHTLDRIMLDGMLPVYRVRGQCRFKRSDIDLYLDSCLEQRPVYIKEPKRSCSAPRKEAALPSSYIPGMKVV